MESRLLCILSLAQCVPKWYTQLVQNRIDLSRTVFDLQDQALCDSLAPIRCMDGYVVNFDLGGAAAHSGIDDDASWNGTSVRQKDSKASETLVFYMETLIEDAVGSLELWLDTSSPEA